MKTILSTNPTFTPGAVNTGTLDFSSVSGFNIAGLLAVLNQTTGTLIYATGQASTGYYDWNNSTKVLTLKVDTSTHSSGDQLQVIYDGPGTASPSGPALTALISGGVTDSVITSSPAILIGVLGGGISNGFTAYYTIKSGSTEIIYGYTTSSNSSTNGLNINSGGIDCPNGITISTSYPPSPTAVQNLRLTVNYILK